MDSILNNFEALLNTKLTVLISKTHQKSFTFSKSEWALEHLRATFSKNILIRQEWDWIWNRGPLQSQRRSCPAIVLLYMLQICWKFLLLRNLSIMF